jgi:ABC-type uncharacterized transport system permease subunit
MNSISVIAFHIVVVVYSVAAALYFVDLAAGDRAVLARRFAPRVFLAAVGLHAAHLIFEMVSGLADAWSPRSALSLCGITASAAYVAIRRKLRIDAVGVAVAPLVLTLYVASEFLRGSGVVTDFPRTLLFLHVIANVLGVGLFLLAGAASGFYLVQERRLKEKRVKSLHGRMPALDALDLTEHRLLLAGFPLLTFGIVSGAVFAVRLDAMSGASAARALLAYATWLLVASVLVLRAVAGWRGRRAAYGTLAGVACVIVVIGIYVARSGGGGL